jgi:hypothetical protein
MRFENQTSIRRLRGAVDAVPDGPLCRLGRILRGLNPTYD